MSHDFLKKLSCLVLDMDGTVYLGNRPIGDMAGTLAELRRRGIRLCYFTNNSSKTAEDYVGKLTSLGLYDGRDTVYTSGMATVSYLLARYPGRRVYLLATPTVTETFREAGVPLVAEGEEADIVVLAYDTTLTFPRLRHANELLSRGALYIATHPDLVCPTEGVPMPDVGSFIRLLESSSGRLPDLVIGKPNALAGEAILRAVGVAAEETAMVGDRLYTDIRFGNNAGFHSILVLSGETTEEMLKESDVCPELVLPDLHALRPLLD
ncbi:MAG: HAD-IIA family hydrolase [Clostridia bacterium]|nr:HAD-IIA family hydrolase [Clostridia bacterium]